MAAPNHRSPVPHTLNCQWNVHIPVHLKGAVGEPHLLVGIWLQSQDIEGRAEGVKRDSSNGWSEDLFKDRNSEFTLNQAFQEIPSDPQQVKANAEPWGGRMEGVIKCPQDPDMGTCSLGFALTLGDLSNCPRQADFRTPVSCSSWECQSHLGLLIWKQGLAKLPAVTRWCP